MGVVVWGALLFAAGAFLTLLAAPILLRGGPLEWLSPTLIAAYSPFCHQLPERTIHVDGVQMLGCGRCASIVVGALLGLLVAAFACPLGSTRCPPRWVFLAALAPLAADAGLALLGLWDATLESRALTGFLAGFGAAHFVLPAATEAALDLFVKPAATTLAVPRGDGALSPALALGLRKEEECHHE